ncbi:hypothetical protein M5K25_009038 [Dendrobium thyrsiflorum]|uniref:RNase H type-1 domain-containing protein n=1 Tax=Dendrobium thyrsiflorum TaxID=117978 RepID=A0ABD0VBI2_DENTH
MVLRNDRGQLLAAAGWSLLHWDSTQVELLAMQYIPFLIQDWMFEAAGLIVEGDNRAIVEAMQCLTEARHWESHPLSGEDFNWTKLFHRVFFNHIPRDCNAAAHFCAHLALNCDFKWLFADRDTDAIPSIFWDILWSDVSLFS